MANEVLVNRAPAILAASVSPVSTTFVRNSAATGWPGDTNGPASGLFRLVVTDGTNYEIVRVTGGQGTASVTVQRAVELIGGNLTSYAFASAASVTSLTPVATAAGLANDFAPAGTFNAVTLGASVNIAASTAASVLVTGALATGIWSIDAQVLISSGSVASTTGHIMYIQGGTASVAFQGPTSSQDARPVVSDYLSVYVSSIVQVLTPGTIAMWVSNTTTSPSNVGFQDSQARGKATGIVCVQLQ